MPPKKATAVPPARPAPYIVTDTETNEIIEMPSPPPNTPNSSPEPSPPPSPPRINRINVGGRKTIDVRGGRGGRGGVRLMSGGSVAPRERSVAPMRMGFERRGEFLVPMTGGSVASRERRVAPPRIPTPMTIQTIPSFQDLQERRELRRRMAVANERARRRRGSLAPKGKGDKDRT
jgi:hypothetical protein